MRQELYSIWLVNGVVGACLSGLALLSSCSTQMTSTTYSSQPEATPIGQKKSAGELLACPDLFRPLRIAFIIDNTGSNGASPGQVSKPGQGIGTDHLKIFADRTSLLTLPEMNLFSKSEQYTNRQVAVYQAIVKLQQAAAAARAKNPNFEGIDVGVAHFPYAPEGLSANDPVDMDDLKKAVFHNGEQKGLPDAMTDLSKVSASEEWKRRIWKMLAFTHYSRGMTPYVTAFNAAKELLLSPQNMKPNDKRQMIVFLITDGLPTDERPKDIPAARAALGKETNVKIISVYKDDANDELQNAEAKKTLKSAYDDYQYGAEYKTFEEYWSVLKSMPASSDVSDSYSQIDTARTADSLTSHIDNVLSCKGKK